jgi:hypothetical protein
MTDAVTVIAGSSSAVAEDVTRLLDPAQASSAVDSPRTGSVDVGFEPGAEEVTESTGFSTRRHEGMEIPRSLKHRRRARSSPLAPRCARHESNKTYECK